MDKESIMMGKIAYIMLSDRLSGAMNVNIYLCMPKASQYLVTRTED